MKADSKASRRIFTVPSPHFQSGDLISVILILCIAAGLILFLRTDSNPAGEKYVEISSYENTGSENSAVKESYPLNTDTVIEIVSLGYYFTVEISGEKVSVTESDCPDGVCRKTPAILSDKESIICVPAKLIIKIVSENNQNGEDYDYVAY